MFKVFRSITWIRKSLKARAMALSAMCLGLGATLSFGSSGNVVPGVIQLTVPATGQNAQDSNDFSPLLVSSPAAVTDDDQTAQRSVSPVPDIEKLVQSVSTPLVSHNTGLHSVSVTFALCTTPAAYRVLTNRYFHSYNSAAMAQTGGFTVGNTVSIPLYKYADQATLANTLTHEYTHAVLNQQGIGPLLPTWLNEGFAWYDGMQAERQVNERAATALTTYLMQGVKRAQGANSLLPLGASVQTTVLTNQTYNVEFQDYLAVNTLITRYGISAFSQFLQDVPNAGVGPSFERHFGVSLTRFMSQFDTHFVYS